jgi:hypothetical protein
MDRSEIDEIVGELYLVPPQEFVAARDNLVRTARQAGNRDLADELRRLRRPTQSAWLVNVLAREERRLMDELATLGRELRDAQTRLDGTKLRQLGAQRQQLITDLLDRARRRAADSGVKATDTILSEVAETLRAALVDLAASSTVLAGRLVRPMSHSGFGPRPHLEPAPTSVPQTVPVAGAQEVGEWSFWPVEHAVATPEGREPTPVRPRLTERRDRSREERIRRAQAELAAAERTYRERHEELATAQDAAQAARDRLRWIEEQRTAAMSEKATADARLSAAQAAEQSAHAAVAEAKQALEAAVAAQEADR